MSISKTTYTQRSCMASHNPMTPLPPHFSRKPLCRCIFTSHPSHYTGSWHAGRGTLRSMGPLHGPSPSPSHPHKTTQHAFHHWALFCEEPLGQCGGLFGGLRACVGIGALRSCCLDKCTTQIGRMSYTVQEQQGLERTQMRTQRCADLLEGFDAAHGAELQRCRLTPPPPKARS